MAPLLFRSDRWLMLWARWLMLSAAMKWWWQSRTECNRDADPAGRFPGVDRTAADRSSDPAELLRRRMAALDLDAGEFARSEPHVFRDLERLCAACKSRGRCVGELREGSVRSPAVPASRDWIDYCPNAAMLSMLSAVQACSAGDRTVAPMARQQRELSI
jgi:hypothetical protein